MPPVFKFSLFSEFLSMYRCYPTLCLIAVSDQTSSWESLRAQPSTKSGTSSSSLIRWTPSSQQSPHTCEWAGPPPRATPHTQEVEKDGEAMVLVTTYTPMVLMDFTCGPVSIFIQTWAPHLFLKVNETQIIQAKIAT